MKIWYDYFKYKKFQFHWKESKTWNFILNKNKKKGTIHLPVIQLSPKIKEQRAAEEGYIRAKPRRRSQVRKGAEIQMRPKSQTRDEKCLQTRNQKPQWPKADRTISLFKNELSKWNRRTLSPFDTAVLVMNGGPAVLGEVGLGTSVTFTCAFALPVLPGN